MKKKVGLIGWRGMVGTVLMSRMREEKDFSDIDPVFFSTSQYGIAGPIELGGEKLQNAYDIDFLAKMDVILTCQGSDYTEKVYKSLREQGWNGHWIDAASLLRMNEEAVIVLDPINSDLIKKSYSEGCKTWVGGNCTVSLMLMAIGELVRQDQVDWISAMTYQAASGAGAQSMKELLLQMGAIYQSVESELEASMSIIDAKVTDMIRSDAYPIEHFGVPLAGSLIPWIDADLNNGQSKEEWKAQVEANKILGLEGSRAVSIDGITVRVGSMRSHAQALTMKLKNDIALSEIEEMIRGSNSWVEVIPNNKDATIKALTPAAVSGTMRVPVGRFRKMSLGPEFLSAFTVGDQLLWGAAEPLRRMLRILID